MTERRHISVVDSHTGGEPTRVVISGGPDLGKGPLSERLDLFGKEHDRFRSAVVNEPRGSDAMVGALLCKAVDESCTTGVIFFNNVGPLNSCIHGTIGVVITLAHIGRIDPGMNRIETPVGIVSTLLLPSGEVRVENVHSYRHAKDVSVQVEGHGRITGDVAWGGNWFFLVEDSKADLSLSNVEALTGLTWKIRKALEKEGITGADKGVIDHIEIFGPPRNKEAQSRNFVLCPGGAYDRSPCGTGTSAKVACLYEDGKLKEGETWRQESIVGSTFDASVVIRDGKIHPVIQGSAHVNAESMLILDPHDPFSDGIRKC